MARRADIARLARAVHIVTHGLMAARCLLKKEIHHTSCTTGTDQVTSRSVSEESGQGIPGGRGIADVTTNRGEIANLHTSESRGGLGQGRVVLADQRMLLKRTDRHESAQSKPLMRAVVYLA